MYKKIFNYLYKKLYIYIYIFNTRHAHTYIHIQKETGEIGSHPISPSPLWVEGLGEKFFYIV